ncbi:MBOAT family protein [Neolewinella lacunae]|uniref:MBOAT family protein n=1 Tax=Neolewinella lacunae TaxID=1517758 RepID=A0A923PMB6_9BACT|nr:MBOAT family protein [Neolewinella lacunae]MBC6996074.1 MBOAT family protein [Neolewinella lacunae]MDN3635135.1 MBOAT family protein [Neolewinella lacunae]
MPIVWGGSLLLPRRWQNAWLLLLSLLLYAWGGVSYTAVLLWTIVFNYGIGRCVNGRHGGLWLALGVVVNLGVLAYFKYTTFAVAEANQLLQLVAIPPFELPRIALPLGISFYTFQAISYLADTYRGTTPPQRNVFRLGLYVSFFPQLIAGPIVRYQDLNQQIAQRRMSWEQTAEGLQRFLIGLAKKVLIANTLAVPVEEIFALDFTQMDAFTAWAGVLLYAGQLYFDFSGYSDMAIGLGLLFGFRLPENFRFPYASRDIRDFWRRWHITLGAWFRDYLYLPLGGSRGGRWRTVRNLLLVFLATGVWHGAAWAFVAWGLWHGLFIVLERQPWWRLRGIPYAFVVVLLGWVLFRTESLALAGDYYRAMAGGNAQTVAFEWAFYWSRELTVVSLVAILLAWPWAEWLPWRPRFRPGNGWEVLRITGLLLLFLLSTNALVNNSLNPFIYFRF